MATFAQFWRRLEAGELKRAYYVCGAERTLVEEAVDVLTERVAPSTLDHVRLSMSETSPTEVWAQLNQYPLDPTSKRLVLVREAERLTGWEMFLGWMDTREVPQTHVVFVSNEESPDTSSEHLARIVKSGKFVKCSTLSLDEGVEWAQRISGLGPLEARRVLVRCGDIPRAKDALMKLAFFPKPVPEFAIDELTTPPPETAFVDELIAMRKGKALQAARYVPVEEYSHVVAQLDWSLEALGRLNRVLRRGITSIRDLISETKLPAFQIKELQRHARHYDRSRVTNCVKVLAFADARLAERSVDGLLEVTAAQW